MDDLTAKRIHDHARGADATTPWSLLLLLMAMTSIGPTTLNVVVPALPTMANRLGSDIATIQLTVSIYLLALASGQLVMGPLSDRFGRRRVVLAALALTAAASVLAVAVATVSSLIVARVLQAFGASAGIVISRAIMRDVFDKNHAAAMIGLVATVMVIAPTFGPLIGGLLDTAFGWEAVFWFTAVTTTMVVVWAALRASGDGPVQRGAGREGRLLSRPRDARQEQHLLGLHLRRGIRLLGLLRRFLGGGAHIIITLMERSSAEYGDLVRDLLDRLHVRAISPASRLSTRLGVERMIWWGIGIEALGVLIALPLAIWAMPLGPAIIFGPQLIVNFGNGLLLPGVIAGAVSVRPQAAGTAAGIVGFMQMSIGAAVAQYAGTLTAAIATRPCRSPRS